MKQETAVDYLTRHDWRRSSLGLERITQLLRQLGNPQDKVPMIHVAGTNGKSSTSSILAAVLTAAGYKTGLYTSPYINRFNERMQIDGQPIEDAPLAALTQQVAAIADAMADHPTEFELITALAFQWFYQQGCDVVVLEVGLGGRLDATNAIPPPLLAVMTAIDLDHVEILGDTLEKIAGEKAGIIKKGTEVVSYPQPPEAAAVLERCCRELEVPLTVADFSRLRLEKRDLQGQSFSFGATAGLHIPLLGPYQINNAALVLTAADRLRDKGWRLPEQALRTGLSRVSWPARFELLRQKPAFIVDGGHNPQGAEKIVEALGIYFPGKKIDFIVGVMADKDYRAMFRLIAPLARRVICVRPDNDRALSATEAATAFKGLGVEATAATSVAAAVNEALSAAEEDGVICAFGSFYMAGEIRALVAVSGS